MLQVDVLALQRSGLSGTAAVKHEESNKGLMLVRYFLEERRLVLLPDPPESGVRHLDDRESWDSCDHLKIVAHVSEKGLEHVENVFECLRFPGKRLF